MPVVAAAFCPHPPLLVPEIAGTAAAELDDLRAACENAIAAMLSVEPDRVVVLGADSATRTYDKNAVGDLSPYGYQSVDAPYMSRLAPMSTPAAAPRLPLSLTIGRRLLTGAGWGGPRTLIGVGSTAPVVETDDRVALLVMGDGAPSRSEQAPGYLDERAEPYDKQVAAALASGDPAQLSTLDTELAAELDVAGWPAWRAAADLLAGPQWQATLRYDLAPYGVGYFVADWLPRT